MTLKKYVNNNLRKKNFFFGLMVCLKFFLAGYLKKKKVHVKLIALLEISVYKIVWLLNEYWNTCHLFGFLVYRGARKLQFTTVQLCNARCRTYSSTLADHFHASRVEIESPPQLAGLSSPLLVGTLHVKIYCGLVLLQIRICQFGGRCNCPAHFGVSL